MRSLLTLVALIATISLLAQTGPGGVEKNDGASKLQVWLRPDGFRDSGGQPASNGETVETWLNFSGYGNDATGSTPGSFEGAPLDSTITFFNGYPAVEFDGDFPGNDGFQLQDIVDDPNAATVIVVLAGGDFVNNVGVFVAYPDGQVGSTSASQKSIGIWVDDDRSLWGRFIESDNGIRSFSTSAGIDLVSNDPLIIMNHADGVGTLSQFGNGALANNTLSYDGTIKDWEDLLIGRQANEEFDGWITEVIVFNKALNEAERIIVDNYLAAKFGIDDLTNDFYAFDNTHPHEVAGIGQTNSVSDTSAYSSEMLGIGIDPANLDDGDFIFFGHDGGDTAVWATEELPLADTNFVRLEREWIIDTTASPGAVTFAIDTTHLPTKTTDFEYYYLWIDGDGDFTAGATPYALTLVDSVYQVANVTLDDGQYATIALYRPVINFSDTIFSVTEASNADFQIEIPYTAYRDITVDYTVDGASTSEDVPSAGTITIDSAQTTGTLSVATTNDSSPESDETIIIDLTSSSAMGAVVGSDSVNTAYINDDDNAESRSIEFLTPCNYSFSRTITIKADSVEGNSDLTDYILLVSFDDSTFLQTASGKIESTSGYDIRFAYADSLTFLEHQIERYDGTDGDYIAWVKVPTLSTSVDTELVMYYGNSDITVDPSTTNVWSEYTAVYHFDNTIANDQGNATFDATAVTASSETFTTSGLIGTSLDFPGTDDEVIEISNTAIPTSGEFSFTFWFNPSSTPGVVFDAVEDRAPLGTGEAADRYFFYDFNGSRQRYFFEDEIDDDMQLTLNQAPNTSAWNLVTLTGRWESASHQLYVNNESALNITLLDGPFSPTSPIRIGGPNINYIHENTNLTGSLDELRIINRQISLAEHTTNLRNQGNPGEFYTLGDEQSDNCTLDESVASIDITIGVSNVDTDAATTVNYQVTGGTAVENTDYSVSGTMVSIPANDSTATFTVNITNDLLKEVNETFTISLFSPTNANLGSNTSFTYTINDDDNDPIIDLINTSAEVNEGSGSLEIGVSLSAVAGQDISVDYSVSSSIASSGSDYILSDGSVTIGQGSLNGSFLLNIIDDSDIESPETLQIDISNPTAGTINTDADSVVVTINDNDNVGIDGPGGVGNLDGSGFLVQWLIADSASVDGSNNVTSWPNQVAISELDMTPGGTAPVRNDSVVNDHAEISFAPAVNDYLESSALSASYFPFNETTIFIVNRPDDTNQESFAFTTATSGTADVPTDPRVSGAIPDDGNVVFDIGSTGAQLSYSFDAGWANGNFQIFNFLVDAGANTIVSQRNNNIPTGGSVSDGDNFRNHSSYNFYLGREGNTDDPFRGDITEYIMYTSPLNDAQVNIVNNYLAAKYDISLDADDDLFGFNSTHGLEVAGIGRVDATNTHVAASAGAITISNASDLGNNEYVLFGHDGGATDSWINSNVPADSIRRLERLWRFDTTGSPGSITVTIDTTQLPSKTSGYIDYVVIVDDDGTFDSDSEIFSTILSDGSYQASLVNVGTGDYVAIGIIIRTINFSSTSFEGLETSSTSLEVSLNVAAEENISLNYAVTDGTATQGSDYSVANTGSITIFAGQTSAFLDPGIIDESELEGDETIEFTLRDAPSGTVLGADSVFTYTITDDDNTRIIEFRSLTDYGYKKRITIQSSEVNADLTDFPFYFTITNDSLRSVGQGGNIEHPNGYDIGFTLGDSLAWLEHDLEYFDSTSGEFVVWVKIPTLSSSVDTELDFYYGNSNIDIDYSSTSVWSDYNGVWHFDDGVDDASSNNFNGTDNQTTDVDGLLGRGRDFDGNDDFIDLNSDVVPTSGEFTISFWYNPDGVDANREIIYDMGNSSGGKYFFFDFASTGQRWYYESANDADVQASYGTAPTNGNWTFVTVTGGWNDNEHVIYEGGSTRVTNTTSVDGAFSPRNNFRLGACFAEYTQVGSLLDCIEFDGQLDEFRIYAGRRTLEFHQAEFSNQNTPGTFYSVDTQDTTNANQILETAGVIDVTVAISPVDLTGQTSVEYDVSGGTATIDDDFTFTSDSVKIAAGEQSASFSFSVVNDLLDENNETLTFSLSKPSTNAKVGTNSSSTFTIEDDDDGPTIAFIDTLSTVNEGSSVFGITVGLNVESGNNASVDYEVKSSTATSGDDFVTLSGTLTINAGSLTKNISFQPIDDPDIEGEETVVVRLYNPVNGSLGADSIHTITLKDNDDLGFEGPGGVGDVTNDGGEGFLKLWLIADSASASGSTITSWSNEVQNISLDYTMTTTTTAPSLVDNAVNGHKAVSFENVDDALVTTDKLSAVSFPGSELTIFVVTEADNINQASYAYATDDAETGLVDGSNNISASIPNGSGNAVFDLSGSTGSATYNLGWVGDFNIFSHMADADTIVIRRNNLEIVNIDPPAANNLTNQTIYNLYLGKTGTDAFQGDIAEFIVFSNSLNFAQFNIINNYLAAKYNLSIDTDLYNFNVTHGTEVAGIGREDASNEHVAASAGVLTISNASQLGDGDYVLFGHDNADIGTWSGSDIPGTGILRTTREWRVDTTGTPGTITVAIDTTFLPAKPVGNEDYIVIVDSDGDFSSGATSYSTTLVDGEYKASDVNVNSGDYFTIGIVTRSVDFNQVSASDFESQATNIQVDLSLSSDENIVIDYVITGGTASGNNVDYSLDSLGTLTIIAGQTTANIPLGIINDSAIESDETIEITLRNPPTGVTLGADSVHTYTIQDDDNFRNVQFAMDSILNVESVDSVYLVVQLDSIDDTNVTTVLMNVTGGTAEASPAPDFTFATDTIQIQANETSDSLLVVILDDVLDEDLESIIFSLSSPTNAGLGDTTSLVYQITDNDTDVVASLQDTTITIDEGGSIAAVVVELDNIAGKDVVVNYAVDGTKSTATGGGTDYTLADGSVTITAGNEFATINVALTDDDIEESAETLTIGISGSNVVLDQADTVVVTISDNDALSGFYGPGGVGNNENNLLWLDAFNINGRSGTDPSDASSLSSWTDNSGNSYVFTSTGTQPTYDADGLNNRPTINISNSQLGFTAPTGFSNSLSNYTMMAVSNQTSGDYLLENNTAGNGIFRLSNSDAGLYAFNDTDYITTQGSTADNISTWMFDIQESNSAEVYRDGTSVGSDNNFSVMSIANNLSIANRYTGAAASDFAGDISEIIIYNNPINEAQRIIVENYLAAKYDLTIANDLYNYQGIFYYDVVGVGDAGNQGQHLEAMSDSLLLISNPNDLDSAEFVFIGHDNGDKLSWTTFEAPLSGDNVRRIAREWRIDTVGNPGTVTFKVDVNNLPTPENGFTQYAIYVDSDGDFNNGATIGQLDFSATSGLYVSDPLAINEGDYLTIGVLKPVVEFTLTASDSTEAFTNPKIEVSLNFTRDEIVTVDYEATGGTATGGNVDYLLADGTLNIAPGNLSADIDLGVIDDVSLETSETVEVTLANPSSNVSLGTNVMHTYTINDNDSDRKINFAYADSTFAENGVDADSVAVQLFLLTNDGMDTVQSDGTTYAIISIGASSTATFTVDYDTLGAFSADTLYIPNGDSTVTFQLQVTDDAAYESSETIIFRLSGANVNVGEINEVTYTVTNDDTAPVIQFAETSAFGQESVSPVQIDVELSAASGDTTKVNYSVSSTNATQGTDFDLADGSVTLDPGETETSILLTVNDDGLAETGEVVTITLATPTNATLGTNTQFDYTILDNDDLGSTGPGGVGNNTSNLLWLRADNFNTIWADTSGNNYDATVINTPTLNSSNSNFNNQSTVTFDGSTDAFDIDPFVSGVSDYDVFMVYETSSTSAQQVFSTQGGLVLGHELGFGYTDDSGNQGTEFTGTSAAIYQYSLQSGSSNAEMRIDGSDDNTSTYTQTDIAANSFIGSSTSAGSHFNGDIAEIIFYNSTLNSAQRKIVETYLGERYGITNANDLYDNAGFTDDVAGIGRDSAIAIHTAATSANQLTVKDANSMSSASDNGDFMLFGHDNAATSSWNSTTNAGIIKLAREWRFDVDGSPGSVTIEVDTVAFDTTARATFPTLALLVSSTGDFDTDLDSIYSLSLVSGSIFQASGVQLSDNDVVAIGALRNISNSVMGDFSNSGTWVTGIVPGNGDDVFIAGTDSIYLTEDVAIGGITIEDGGVLNLDGYKLELDQDCITLNGTGRVDVSGGEVEYSRAGDQCVTCLTYEDVTFSSSGRKFMLDSIVVQGNLVIADNVVELDTDGFPIFLGGNWTNQGTFTADNGLVVLNGTVNQTIEATGAGGESYHKVVVNKASGRVLFESNVTIADSLELTSGVVNLQTNDLTLENTEADHLNGSSASYIQADGAGELFFAIASGETYDLPIGDDDEYSPSSFEINSLTGTLPSISINLRDSKYPDISTDFAYISRYWTFNDVNITSISYNWTFTYTNADVAGGSEGTIEPIKFDGSNVDDILDFPSFSRNLGANQITWNNLTSFSSGTGGVEDGGSLLPVELLHFDVELVDKEAVVSWSTASELNNDHFEIEVSLNGEQYSSIASIQGQGNSSEVVEYSYRHRRPAPGVSYYRLKQVDFDGTVDYSEVVALDNFNPLNNQLGVFVYPNPTTPDNINLRIESNGEEGLDVRLVNLTGQLFFQTSISEEYFDEKITPVKGMSSGIYLLIINQGSTKKIHKVVVK